MPNFKDIDEARKILGLGKTATLRETKALIAGWLTSITPISIVASTK